MRDSTQCTRKAANEPGNHTRRGNVSSIRRIASLACFVILSLMGYRVAGQAPTTQASSISVLPLANSGTSVIVGWSNGNGANRIVVVRSFTGAFTPTNGVGPNAGPVTPGDYAAATDLDGAGGAAVAKVVFNSATAGHTGTSFTLTGIAEDTRYFVTIYEYNGSGGTSAYNLLSASQNPIGFQNNSTPGTFTRPAGVTKVQVFAWGGGGGGGGADSNSGENRAGGGGAGGTFTRGTDVTIGANITITIGAGGGGGDGTDSPMDGTPGGTTTFASPSAVTAVGGNGGLLANGTDRTGNGGTTTTGVTANGGAGGEAPPGGTTTDATASGAGGASGGPAGAGGAASGSTAGTAAGAGAGNGAVGLTGLTSGTGSDGNNASQLGGGGSGGWDNLSNNDSGNGSAGGSGFRGGMVVTWTTPPTPTITIGGPNPTNGAPVFNVVFSTPINVSSFIGADVTISGTTAGTEASAIAEIAPNNGTTFTITVTGMTGGGTVIANMAAGVVTDVSGNLSLVSNAGTTINYNYDVTGPTPTISVSGPNPTNVNPVFQVVFNEPITLSSFVGTDVTLTGTAGATTATILEIAPNDGTTFSITASGMSGTGTVIANMAVGVVTDRALTPNTSLVSTPANVTIDYDITPPPAPSVPDLTAATDSGFSNSDDNTNDNTPNFTVTGTAGMLLEILDGAAVVGSIGSASGGAETITVSTLADGVNRSITARTTDAAGNTTSSAALLVTIDIVAPAAPGIPDMTAGTDSGQLNTDDNTNDTTPDFTGTSTTNFTVTILSSAVSVGSGLVGGGGTYTITTSALAEGGRTITATQTDLAGNTSLPSASLSVTIDTIVPAAPTTPNLQPGSDSGPLNNDDYTNITTPSFDATGTSGFRLELIDGASTVVATIASASGAMQTLASSVLSPGPHTMKTRTTDIAGNFTDSGGTLVVTIDTTPPATPAVPNLTAASDTGSSNTDDITSDNTPTFDVTGSVGLLLELRDGTTVVGSIASASGGAETITSSVLVDGVRNMNARSTDLAGNVASSANLPVTIDTQFPTVSSIVANTTITVPHVYAPLVNGVTTPPTTTVVFTVTFNQSVTGVDMTDFIVNTNGPSYVGVSVSPTSASVYEVSVTGLTGTGTVNIDFNDDNSVADLAGNILGGPAIDDGDLNTAVALGNNQFFTLALPEPSGAVPALNVVTVTSNSIDVSWTDVAAAQAPGFYLVMLKTAASSFDPLADGTFYPDDVDLTDGDLKINVAQGIGSASFAVNSGVDYDLIIYPYTLDANSIVLGNRTTINYFVTTPATNTASTPTAQQTLISAGNGIASISSLDTSAPNFRAVFSFTVQDDGTNPGDDDSPFRFQTLTINADNGNGNSIANWSEAIANTNARLSDNFGHSQTANITVNAGSIVISSIASSSAADLGYIPDDGTRIYTLEVFLRTSLLGNLPQTIDGLQFVMDVDEFDFGYNDAGVVSSRIRPGETTFSGAGNGVVTVVATRLNFSTQPPPSPFVLTNVVSTFAAPDFSTTPVVRARDINGNTDLGYSNTINITNAGAVPMLNLLPGNTLALAGGIAFFPVNFQYQDDGNGQLTAAVGGLISGVSSAVAVAYDNNNRIIAGGFIEPPTISSLFTGPGFTSVFDFNIVDDNFGAPAGDGAPTRFSQLLINQLAGNDITDWTEAIASARLVQGVTVIPGTVNPTNITFGGMANAILTDPGFVSDNTSKNYVLQIILRSTMGGTLAQTIDNLNFNFQMTEANVTLIPTTSSTFAAAGTQQQSSGGAFNAVTVVATTMRFSTQPNGTLLANKDINQQAPINVPVVRAEDVNNNVDNDYLNTATIFCALNVSPSIFLSSALGVYTFPATFRYTETGNGTLTITAPGLANGVSNLVTVNAAQSTTITAGAPPVLGTISSILDTAPEQLAVFKFDVNDDAAGPGPTDDGLPTLISQIVIRQNLANDNIGDWTAAIAGASLTDGTTSVNATAISPTSITFGGISTSSGQLGFVGDNTTKNYSLRIFLRASLGGMLPTQIDGKKFEFQVTQGLDIVLATNSTLIINAETETSGNTNIVAVVATALRYTFPTVASTVSLDTPFPNVAVEAVDANNNRDLGYTATVRENSNPAGATMFDEPVDNTTAFVAGVLAYLPTFKYTTGVSGANVTLTLKAGASTVCGGPTLCATSPALTLLSSFESSVVSDPTYSYFPAFIEYELHQEAANIQLTPSSREIARVLLIDGSRVNYNYGGFLITTGTDNDIFPNGDEDGAETRLNSITFNVANPATLRRLALYSGAVELGEINVDALNIPDGTPNQDFTFSGGPLLIAAPDNSTSDIPVPLSLRASFLNTAPFVTDGDFIDVRVSGASLGSGSNFFTAPSYIAGVLNGFSSPLGVNRIDVQTTRLDFVTDPAPFAGIETLVTAGAVEAHDQFGLLDTDFDGVPATVSAPAGVNGTFVFAAGELDISSMTYSSAANGTLTVTAGGFSSNTNNVVDLLPNVSTQCTNVEVLHVKTSFASGGAGGVITVPNLIGGTADKVVFGFTFDAPYTISSPNEPLISRFTITFSAPTTGVFFNMRVLESTSPVYSAGLPNVTTLGATVTQPTTSTLQVEFPPLSERDPVANPQLSYFLVVDVDINASGNMGGSPMVVSIVDDNILGSGTNTNIVVSNGSSKSSTVNPTAYNFASVFPPSLDSSYPALAQTNIDPTQSTLRLFFSVPVYSLDGFVQLVDKATGVVTPLTAANGTFPGTPVTPIIFNIPMGTMAPNKEYYVLIAQGNRTNLTGIMDESDNLFPGISYSGTLYFRTTDFQAPKLLGPFTIPNVTSDPFVSDASPQSATLNLTMDKKGRAFYMVLNANTAAPSVNEIKGLSVYLPGGVASRGSINVNTNNPISQFGIMTPLVGTFTPGPKFVWICAEAYSEKDGVPTAIPTLLPYGAPPAYGVGLAGPTLSTFTVPGGPFPGLITLNTPNISVCNESYQVLNSPIIITEGLNPQFNTGGGQVTMNLVLPAGFEFDNTMITSVTPNVPVFGSLTLLGSDFINGSARMSFLSNTIVTIRYQNQYQNGGIIGGSKDKIVISGLRVRSNTTSTGALFRLGGTALPTIVDATPLAQLSSFDSPSINFDNSYSTSLGYFLPDSVVVTSIPDNAIPADITLSPFVPASSNDFGPSSFSGLGVNINTLTLSAVTPDVPFNLTIKHTDNNGCVSENPVQYLVYDHTSAVNISLGGVLDQGPYCAINPNFAIGSVNPPTYGLVVRDVPYDNLASYYMESLTAGIPPGTVSLGTDPIRGQVINPTDSAGAWNSIINGLPIQVSSILIGGRTYRSYTFDEARILDANALSLVDALPGNLPNPYEVFRKTTAFQANTYYEGGTLGLVELTGTYRSISNQTVQVVRKQLVEFYLPAIPIVEVGLSNQTAPGMYCEAGGKIQISGFPEAVIGKSKGRFTVTDAALGTIIYDVPSPGVPTIPPVIPPNLAGSAFVDFGNGSAELDPAQLTNTYRPIRITYTYQQDGSPCVSTGEIVIQVAPNPITDFIFTSAIGPNTPFGTSYCEDRIINFDASSSTIATGFSIASYAWIFGEISSGTNTATGITSSHTYDLPATYTVDLKAISNTGCASVPSPYVAGSLVEGSKLKPVTVGGIPVVKYKLDGVSKADAFRFTSNDEDVPFPGVVNPAFSTSVAVINDFIAEYVWDFGDSTNTTRTGLGSDAAFNADIVTHSYTTVGRKSIDLTVTSLLGCRNSLALQGSYRSIVVLPREVLPAGSASVTDFEPLTGGHRGWQVWGTGTTVGEIQAGAAAATWEYGPPNGTGAVPADPFISKTRVWKTNIKNFPVLPDSTYNPGENSAIYSPSFDLQNLTRPMISFNAVVQMESSDGVVLEYSLDNKNIADPTKLWKALGGIGSGEDWYTDQGIAGRPGTQTSNDFGWSRIEKTNWQAPKHVLDDLFPPISAVVPTKAVFRWAIGSAAPTVDVQGFTLDNVRIGDRTRTILLESFASTSNTSTQEASENTFVQTFIGGGVGTEVVKLNYHLNFPGKDPFNEDNPADPSSRALFYNITATPRSVLDGEKDSQDRIFSQWGQTLYNLRTLQLAQADIKITPTMNTDGSISIMVKVTSRVLQGIQPNTLVHMVALEKQIMFSDLSSTKQGMVKSNELMFEYVVKKMLPSAAGTQFGAVLPDTVSRFFGPFLWKPQASKLYPSANDLVIAVFLQESTPPYEVYQVELVEPINDPLVVTGLEGLTAEQVLVYPNPANHDMTVQMPGSLARPARLSLIDQTGREALTGSIPEGADRNTISVRDLSAGIYILTIDMGEGVLTRKKVMVVHQD